MCVYIYICIYIYISAMNASHQYKVRNMAFVCGCGCVYVCVYIYIYVCIYMYIYIYMQKHVCMHMKQIVDGVSRALGVAALLKYVHTYKAWYQVLFAQLRRHTYEYLHAYMHTMQMVDVVSCALGVATANHEDPDLHIYIHTYIHTIQMVDVVPRALGVATANHEDPNRQFATIIIPACSPIPEGGLAVTSSFGTSRDNQTGADIEICEVCMHVYMCMYGRQFDTNNVLACPEMYVHVCIHIA
jgi:hypothetical protein